MCALVTGVQTCALPITNRFVHWLAGGRSVLANACSLYGDVVRRGGRGVHRIFGAGMNQIGQGGVAVPVKDGGVNRAAGGQGHFLAAAGGVTCGDVCCSGSTPYFYIHCFGFAFADTVALDRKSTRLNSSH